jgi:ubiquinone/menaquinone biosynthesis C-methylase UbiE
MSLPKGDKTPADFKIEKEDKKEEFKKIVRQYLYPVYLKIKKNLIEKRFSFVKDIGFNELFLGQKGNDYEAHRKRVNNLKNIHDSTVLIIGIGTGKDLESWLKYNPKKIIAVDYFNYEKSWSVRKEQYKNIYNTEIEFLQSDIIDMKKIASDSIDIIGSDAVFEHINRFEDAIVEMKRVLKKEGVLYANFGPLWNSFGGDHMSGSDDFKNGYNHIRLNKEKYNEYLETFGEFTHSEHDGRTWINNNLFSYLKASEYLNILEKHLDKIYCSAIVDEKSLKYKEVFPTYFNQLTTKHGEENLLISGMTIIYDKK